MRPAADIPGLRRAAREAREALGPLAPLVAPIAAISVLGLALSMGLPLFALMLERAGYSGTVIGLNTMAAPLAMVLSAPLMPRILAWLGLARLTMLATVLLAAMFVVIPLLDTLWAWTLLRFVWGICSTALFFSSEYWIVAAAPPATRGRAIAIYAIALSGAFLLGPLVLLMTGSDGVLPFSAAALITLCALPFLIRGAAHAPDPGAEEQPDLGAALRFFRTDPSLLFAVVLFGAIEFGALSLISVWGVRAGMGAEAAVVLMALFAAGGMALQLPLGWAADRFNPRHILTLIAAIAVVAPLAILAAAPSVAAAALPMIAWGGFGAGLYTVALTALGGRYSGVRLAEANAAVTMAYGLGALLSPGFFGFAMDSIAPPHGLLYTAAVVALLYLVLALWRLARAP
ncbi:MAG: MFS transporter [Pseudomonadota bacterium]